MHGVALLQPMYSNGEIPFFSSSVEAIAITIMSTQDVNCEGIYLHGKNEEFTLDHDPVFSRVLFDFLSSSVRSLAPLDYRTLQAAAGFFARKSMRANAQGIAIHLSRIPQVCGYRLPRIVPKA
jgi:hypothetical protein